jgi:hypothetical protein
VLDSVTAVVERRLKLKVNREKSSVRHASKATLLGFGFYFTRSGRVGIRVDPKAIKRLKDRLRELTGRSRSMSMPCRIDKLNKFIGGWMAYFHLAQLSHRLRELDKWLFRRLRQIRWKEWKRYSAKRRNLRKLGIPDRSAREWAASSKGYWRIAGSAVLQRSLPTTYWDDLGLLGLQATWRRLRLTT